jgi:hypothetical protein
MLLCWGFSSVVEYMPNTLKALGSIPSMAKKRERERKKKKKSILYIFINVLT